MATSRRDARGVVLCLVSACGFGVMAILGKEAYDDGVNVSTLLAGRFVLAAAVFWAIVVPRRPARPPRRVVLAGLGLGAIGYSAQAGLFFTALERMDASLVSLLLYTYPAFVFCAAVALRREQATRRKAAALVLASAGAILVLVGGGTGALDGAGVAIALGAALTYTAYILVADGVVGRADPFLLSALVATGAAATFAVTGALRGTLDPGTGGWEWIVAIAVFSTVLPVSTFLLGLERVGAATASIVSTVEPVVTVGLAVAIFGDSLSAAQIAGGALVLGAVVALQAGTDSVPGRVPPDHAAAGAPARPLAREPA